MANFILVTHWTGGDVYPFIRLGKLLRIEGHDVTILTHCVYEEKAKAAGLRFLPVDTMEEYKDLNRDLSMLADPIGRKDEYLRFHSLYHGKERLLREVGLIEKVMTPESIIIARHRSSISGLLAAEKHHLRYASMILAPNYFSHMELHDELFGDAFCEEINAAREVLGLPPITDWKDWTYSPKTILCGWPDWYSERDETWADSAVPIGYIPDPAQKEASAALADQEDLFGTETEIGSFLKEAERENVKTAIVTGGSSRMVSKDFYSTAIRSCILAGVSTIAVTPYDEFIPEDLPDSVLCVHSAPIRDIMKKVDIVVHHGGMGTISEAIDAAIPQVILPHLTDGPDNADRLAALGIASKFPPKMWDPEKIAESIRRWLFEEDRSICIRYQNMNQDTYAAKPWKDVLSHLVPYELPEQREKRAAVRKDETSSRKEEVLKKQVSREMLLKLMKKKQESKGN
ncbi:MAG: glycosyltransferase family 1 protein [Clostridiales bacterium]|nr:glycosyltransferase family 1 protein [Clostridiales bacterium]